MHIKRIILGLFFLLASCVTREQASLYAINNLIDRVSREEKGETLPKAWGLNWPEHWKDQYARMRKYGKDVNVDTERVIKVIEKERLRRRLPSVEPR